MFPAVPYGSLNSRQKENYNVHKVAARLADFGFTSLRLTDDFEGADVVALHVDGETMLRVQLKSRMAVNRTYGGKGIHIAFRLDDRIFLYPHDEMVARLEAAGRMVATSSWNEVGRYDWPRPPPWARKMLENDAL